MKGAGADFHVVGLQQGAALAVPELVQRQDDLLESLHCGRRAVSREFYRVYGTAPKAQTLIFPAVCG